MFSVSKCLTTWLNIYVNKIYINYCFSLMHLWRHVQFSLCILLAAYQYHLQVQGFCEESTQILYRNITAFLGGGGWIFEKKTLYFLFIHWHLCVFRAWSKPWRLWCQHHHHQSSPTITAGKVVEEHWGQFLVKDALVLDIQPVLLLSSHTLPSPTFLPPSSSWMSQDRLPSTADTGKIQIIAFNPPKKDGVSRGQGHPTTAESWMALCPAGCFEHNPHPPPWQPTPSSTKAPLQPHLAPLQPTPEAHTWWVGASQASSRGCYVDPQEVIIIFIQAHKNTIVYFLYTHTHSHNIKCKCVSDVCIFFHEGCLFFLFFFFFSLSLLVLI